MSTPDSESTLRRSTRTQKPLDRYTPAPPPPPPPARSRRRRPEEKSPPGHLPKRQAVGPSENDKILFIEELKANKIEDEKIQIIEKYLLNEPYLMQHSRSLTNDFMKIISKENDGENIIYSKIKQHCDENFTKMENPTCFCCGERIFPQDEKACDHVIPIISMLMTVAANSVPNNLHYIHKSCNSAKSNKNILQVFNEIGKPGGIFRCSRDNTTSCKEMFINILNSIEFRPKHDIEYRISQIKPLNKDVHDLIEKFELFFNDIKGAAGILTTMKNRPASAPAPGKVLGKGKKLTQRKKVLLHNPNIRRKNSRKPRKPTKKYTNEY